MIGLARLLRIRDRLHVDPVKLPSATDGHLHLIARLVTTNDLAQLGHGRSGAAVHADDDVLCAQLAGGRTLRIDGLDHHAR